MKFNTALCLFLALSTTTSLFGQGGRLASGQTTITLSKAFTDSLDTLSMRLGLGSDPGSGIRLIRPLATTSFTQISTYTTDLESAVIVDSKFYLSFPMVSGTASAADTKLELIHSGGLLIQTPRSRVTLSMFTIENLTGQLGLRGVVTSNGEIVGESLLFSIKLSGAPGITTTSTGGKISVQKASIKLTEGAALILNTAIGFEAFEADMEIGAGDIDVTLTGKL